MLGRRAVRAQSQRVQRAEERRHWWHLLGAVYPTPSRTRRDSRLGAHLFQVAAGQGRGFWRGAHAPERRPFSLGEAAPLFLREDRSSAPGVEETHSLCLTL